MDEEDGEEGEVGVGHDDVEAGRRCPAEGQSQLRHVVEVTRHAPPAGD